MEVRIHKWSEIADGFKDGFILGNGASIAISKNFSYTSLLEQAVEKDFLDSNIKEIFNYFQTSNFELILRILQDAYFVAEKLNIEGAEKLKDNYFKLREALIKTIGEMHCEYNEAKPHFRKIIKYLSSFKTIVSLNYDLIIYWALMDKKRELRGKNLIKDCFIDENGRRFCYDWEWLRKPDDALKHAVLLFYQHGNLTLAIDAFGNEEKIVRNGDSDDNLLATIFKKWEENFYSPLIVSEGTSEQKLKAIRRSSYLSNIYDNVLPNLGKSVVIYGSSLSRNDRHIINQLLRNKELKRIAISVLDKEDLQKKYSEISDVQPFRYFLNWGGKVKFFDAKTCWIYEG